MWICMQGLKQTENPLVSFCNRTVPWKSTSKQADSCNLCFSGKGNIRELNITVIAMSVKITNLMITRKEESGVKTIVMLRKKISMFPCLRAQDSCSNYLSKLTFTSAFQCLHKDLLWYISESLNNQMLQNDRYNRFGIPNNKCTAARWSQD